MDSLPSGTVLKVMDLEDEVTDLENLIVGDRIRIHWAAGVEPTYQVLGIAEAGIYVGDRHLNSNPLFFRRNGPNRVTK